ncbi:uncharacterized protein LOC119980932 isoform X3 [Tripterygium wilfordii]|uniref:uncharacterized protein LOC119980932 isoform X3 n=1 Tax=Tripterygium wilfordii TaxID=458696 RepID=UPI0018F839A5|nr:uncharacterized protein LOC119980932 isoform X3 [Tripterygium wilfordii]
MASSHQRNKSSLSKKKVTDINDQFTDQKTCANVEGELTMPIQGSSLGTMILNMDTNTGRSSGHIDQTVAGQLSAIKVGKRTRKENDAKHRAGIREERKGKDELRRENDALKEENDALKKENEQLNNLMTQQYVDSHFSDQFLNLPGPSQPMQTGGGERLSLGG